MKLSLYTEWGLFFLYNSSYPTTRQYEIKLKDSSFYWSAEEIFFLCGAVKFPAHSIFLRPYPKLALVCKRIKAEEELLLGVFPLYDAEAYEMCQKGDNLMAVDAGTTDNLVEGKTLVL